MTARVILNWIVVVVLCAAAAAATQKTADAETYAVRVVRDVPYLEGGRYADGKDKLDIYLPEGRRNAAVIVSYYGNQLMGGDKSEDAYIGRRFAAAGFVTVVVNYRLSPAVSHPAHIQDAAASFAWVKRHIAEHGGNADQVKIEYLRNPVYIFPVWVMFAVWTATALIARRAAVPAAVPAPAPRPEPAPPRLRAVGS